MAISAKDLIEKKKLIEDKKDKQIQIEVPETGTFLFRIPTLVDYEDAGAYGEKRKSGYEENKFLIHSCCLEPNLKDSELLEAYGVKNPIDIIDKIFMVGEVSTIATTLVEKAGFKKDAYKVVEKAKNS